MKRTRRMPIGAEVVPGEGTHFRVWAPARREVAVVLSSDGGGAAPPVPLQAEGDGYFSGLVAEARPGRRYRLRLDGGDAFPDPASRFQPEGPHGPSQIVDPDAFAWSDAGWQGLDPEGQIAYELHLGTFTPEGTWDAAARELPELARLGVTVLEIMPVHEFPGRFGWGYDGVDLFAPYHLYGTPDDARRFVDQAHALGLGVILDVVYNHLGPDGNYLPQFSPHYFTPRYTTDWGEAINFDGPDAGPVREFYAANAAYWVREFHFDGLRLDATQNIYDASEPHILSVINDAARAASPGRGLFIVGENEPQETRLVRPRPQGHGLDALWNDDFHHSAHVALSHHDEAYYTDYLGTPQEFISAVKWGYLYQGQRYKWQGQRRGTPSLDLHPARFVTFLANHDQLANSCCGRRTHQISHPGCHHALTALLLLGPNTPMLFQGQEFSASSPFVFFADHGADRGSELARLVRKGRAEFISQFRSQAQPETQRALPDPGDRHTFERCKLDLGERERHAGTYALHRDLIALRRGDAVFSRPRQGGVDGAVLGPMAFVLRFFGGEAGDRLLLINLGRDLHLDPAPEPLLAPPAGACWQLAWSSEDPRYGGLGTAPVESIENWRLPGAAAVVLRSAPAP